MLWWRSLRSQWMLEILLDKFYWPNLEDDATWHKQACDCCLRFEGRQDKDELYPLLATYPVELVYMDILTIENPCTGVDVNIVVLMDHFTCYAKAVITSTQTLKAPVIAFSKNLSQIMVFPKKLLTHQGHNCESQLIKELCKLTNIWKVRTTPYHP